LVEVSSDVVFDETNDSPREQVDLDDVDEEDVPAATIRTMAIGTMVHPLTQTDEQVHQEACDQGGA
jgi:hypothetical protein